MVHHVRSRFIDREWFFTHAEERAKYLRLLGRALGESDWRCLAYCLMSNHIHLALVAGDSTLSSWVQRVHSPFARWFNDQHERIGPLFADRPAMSCVGPTREGQVIAYIHNNPVRAKLVGRAGDSDWSSHAAYIGEAERPRWLHVEEGLARSRCADSAAFDAYVASTPGTEQWSPSLAKERAKLRKFGTLDVGTPTVREERIEFPILLRSTGKARPPTMVVLDAVAAATGVDRSQLSRRHAKGRVAHAKQVAVHVAARMGTSRSEISAALDISPQRGSKLALMPLSDSDEILARRALARIEELAKTMNAIALS